MQLNDKQYEQIAQWLDADEADRPALDSDLRTVAESILRDQADLGDVLDVHAPRTALHRAQARLMAELARPSHRVRWFARATAVAAVVALVVTGSLLFPWANSPNKSQTVAAELSAEAIGQTMAQATEAGVVDLLADELATIAATTYASTDGATLEMRLDAIEDDLLEGTLIDEMTAWPLDDDGLSS